MPRRNKDKELHPRVMTKKRMKKMEMSIQKMKKRLKLS